MSPICFLYIEVVELFPLNFSSAGKVPFPAGKAKNMPAEVHFPEGEAGGEWSEGHGPALGGAKLLSCLKRNSF